MRLPSRTPAGRDLYGLSPQGVPKKSPRGAHTAGADSLSQYMEMVSSRKAAQRSAVPRTPEVLMVPLMTACGSIEPAIVPHVTTPSTERAMVRAIAIVIAPKYGLWRWRRWEIATVWMMEAWAAAKPDTKEDIWIGLCGS
mgnify:CR=1 FL=1